MALGLWRPDVSIFHLNLNSKVCPCLRTSLAFRVSNLSPVSGGHSGSICVKMDAKLQHDNVFYIDPNRSKEDSLRRELYPPIEPYSTGSLKVSEIHTLYWEQSGNPDGYPIVFLHGGPGAGTSSSNRRFFDPTFYRIVLFDQRGAGKSTPHACLEENTTWDLVDDIEKLRKHLGVEEWQVFGGSWGSTLALAYAQSYPEHVTGIILRGIFLIRKKEIDWFYEGGGTAAIYPDAWEEFQDVIPEDERGNFVVAYNKRLTSNDPVVQLTASKAWTNWEMVTSYLLTSEESVKRGEDKNFSLGRYDVVCPMMSAWDLHKAWPEARFNIVLNAGHSANEPGTTAELVAANEHFKGLLKTSES